LREGKEVTTANFYLRNILQFLGYLKDTPPSACRLRRAQIHGVIRVVHMAVRNLARPIVTHQLKVKAKKMANIVSRESLRRCQEQARVVIPELLSKSFSSRDRVFQSVVMPKSACFAGSEIVFLSPFQPGWRTTAGTTSETTSPGTSRPFFISIYGHRLGVLTNMTVSEVEAPKADRLLPTDTGYVITVGTELQTKVPHRLCFILNVSWFSVL